MGEVEVPGTRCGGRRPSARSRTSRSPACGWSRAHDRALARIKAAAAEVNGELGVLEADWPTRSPAAADEVAARRARRRVPDRRVPDRLGHVARNMNANEVHRHARRRAARPRRSTRTTTSTPASRSNDVFPSASTSPPPRPSSSDLVPALEHLAAALEAKAARVRERGEVRAHAPDGRHAGHAGPGVRRLRGPGRAAASSGWRPPLPRLGELPLGGTAVGTGINTPPGFARAVIAELARATGLPLTEARDHFEAQGAQDALVELSASCARSRSASTRSPTTCAGWAPARAPASARSTCPTFSRAVASCPAR